MKPQRKWVVAGGEKKPRVSPEDGLRYVARIRPLNSAEKGALLLAVLLVAGGLLCVVHPMEGYLQHPSDTGGRVNVANGPEYVTKTNWRIGGALAAGMGMGIGWIALRAGRKRI